MKPLFILIVLVSLFNVSDAQKTYNISANTSWSTAAYPSYCSACTFKISSGKTLTIDNSATTCANCVFSGGNISMTQNFTCQSCSFTSDSVSMNNTTLNLQSSTTSFSGVIISLAGNSSINATSPVNITNSAFTFQNNSFFNNTGGTLTLTKSVMYFYNNSYFIANAGPVNLKTTSSLIAGNGSTSSNAYIEMNGAQLNIYDNSFISLTSKNNTYINWSSFNSISNNKTYATATNTMNCGGVGQNKCSAPNVYGPTSLNSSGIISGNVLPIVLSNFNATIIKNEIVDISWETQEETNSDYFTVERSEDGAHWAAIGTIQAKGNSNVINYYSFNDATPLNGSNYYRLKMVDMDGENVSSSVIHIATSSIEKETEIYPNPVTGLSFNLKVATTEPVITNIFSMEGRLICTKALQGQFLYQVQLPANTMRNSYLAVQVICNGRAKTFNILNR